MSNGQLRSEYNKQYCFPCGYNLQKLNRKVKYKVTFKFSTKSFHNFKY